MAGDTPNVTWKGGNINDPEYQAAKKVIQKLLQDARKADNPALERLAVKEENRCKTEGIWPYIDEGVTTVYNEMRKRFAENKSLRNLLTKEEKVGDGELVAKFFEVVEKHGNTITIRELENASNIGKNRWTRKLLDPAFVLTLKKEAEQKLNRAKTSERKDYWKAVLETTIDELAQKAAKRIRKGKEVRYEERYAKLEDAGDEDNEIADLMNEEENRGETGRKPRRPTSDEQAELSRKREVKRG